MEQEQKKSLSFVFTIIAIIVGVAFFKQFDFKTYTFEKPALAAIYGITFIFSIVIIIRKYRGK